MAKGEDDRSLPDGFLALDELGQPPIQNRSEASVYRKFSLEDERIKDKREAGKGDPNNGDDSDIGKRFTHDSLEHERSEHHAPSFEDDEYFDEVALPPPVDEPAVRGRDRDRDHREHGDDEEKAEPQARRQRSSVQRELASRTATKIYTLAYLVFFSILGTLARVGLQALTFYPDAPVTQSVLWANFGGSFFLGFLAEDQRLFQEEWGLDPNRKRRLKKSDDTKVSAGTANGGSDNSNGNSQEPPPGADAVKKTHGATKKTIPLYIGLATGFCGSFTSFSSFQHDVFLALSNSAPTMDSTSTLPRGGGHSFLALLASLILTPCLSLAALKLGAHFALGLDRFTPTIAFRFTRKVLDPFMVAVAVLTWFGAVIMAIWPPDRAGGPAGADTLPSPASTGTSEKWRGEVVFACVLAPLGCLLRFYASLLLNARRPAFPLGTFAVNMLGTLCEAVFYDLQHARLPGTGLVGGGLVGCQLLQGAMDGFCGCATTISTWVAELNGLRRRHSYVYGAASLGGGLAITLAVMGGLRWSVGFQTPVCVT